MTGTAITEISADRWVMLQRMAQAFATSDLVPESMQKKHGNCIVALLLAEQMRENPLMVMQNIYFVHGRPGWAAQYMIARANNSGKLVGPLRWRTEGEKDQMAVTCYGRLREAPTDDNLIEVTVTYQMAVADGWTRNEKYKTIREQMLVWRSATWLIRRHMPEVMFGLPTVDELEDTIKDVTPPKIGIDDFKPGALREQLRASVAATEEVQVSAGGEVPHPHGDGEGDAATDVGDIVTAAEGESPSPPSLDLVAALDARLREAAANGKRALNRAWLAMNPLERDLMRGARQSYEDMTA